MMFMQYLLFLIKVTKDYGLKIVRSNETINVGRDIHQVKAVFYSMIISNVFTKLSHPIQTRVFD